MPKINKENQNRVAVNRHQPSPIGLKPIVVTCALDFGSRSLCEIISDALPAVKVLQIS